MENGPEITSNVPANALPTGDVEGEDVAITDSITADSVATNFEAVSNTAGSDSDVVSTDSDVQAASVDNEAVTEPASESAATDIEEAPAPQPVELFDLSDDLSEQSAVAMFDMDEETVEATSSVDATLAEGIEEPSDTVAVSPAQAENEPAIPGSDQHAASADDEIFEQVMGSSRVDDIPVGRRSTPGSIPLPPQLAEEQARRERAAASPPVDARGRRHSLPETGRTSRRTATASPATGNPRQPAAPPAVDVICPKCQRTTSTRFTFCMKCGTDFPVGYVASLTGHHPQPSTPGSRDGVRDTRTTVRQINRIHEGRANGATGSGAGSAQTSGQEEWTRVQSGLAGNPFLVSFLSFLMPGLGHMMMGEHKKGLPWLFAGIAAMAFLPSWTFLMWIPLLLRVASAINAYQLAVIRQDDQREPFDMDDDA